MNRHSCSTLLLALCLAALTGCREKTPDVETRGQGQRPSGIQLNIAAGSENKSLESIVQEFGHRQGIAIA
jgi:predicted component of type VI protein secretion system